MIQRYENSFLREIWSDEKKVANWRRVELAVIEARLDLGLIPEHVFRSIGCFLRNFPLNLQKWLELEKELNHDLNAFVALEKEILPEIDRCFYHDGMTSYDTEEPAFALVLTEAVEYVLTLLPQLEEELVRLAKLYRFTPMNARTHGQEAEMQSFGSRILAWIVQLRNGVKRLKEAKDHDLIFSKISGAIGKYTTISPELEEKALGILGLKPFYGATQIIPRELYLPTAQALCQITQTIAKIAEDIWLMAQSGKPLAQEPFGKKQKGSSAMPHKKNPISSEKLQGMARMARGYLAMLQENIHTRQERTIEQSSVERVVWPDLFHVTAHAITTLTKVLGGLRVYPDNMLWEINNSRGCYASAQVKDFLKKYGEVVSEEEVYLIVQLAAFNAHEPGNNALELRNKPNGSLEETAYFVDNFSEISKQEGEKSIEKFILGGTLRVSADLPHNTDTVVAWNKSLQKLFSDPDVRESFSKLFLPEHLLKSEQFLFEKVLGVDSENP